MIYQLSAATPESVCDALGIPKDSPTGTMRSAFASASEPMRSAVAVALLLHPEANRGAVDAAFNAFVDNLDSMPSISQAQASKIERDGQRLGLSREAIMACQASKVAPIDFIAQRAAFASNPYTNKVPR